MIRMKTHLPLILAYAVIIFFQSFCKLYGDEVTPYVYRIPKINEKPKIETFADMAHAEIYFEPFLKITDFAQSSPYLGDVPSERTVLFLGYDQDYIYAIALCFDSQPSKLKKSYAKRDGFSLSEDAVNFLIDTDFSHRRAYSIWSNTLGVQLDGIEKEGVGFDNSFDLVFKNETRINEKGYVILFEIPFKSLRFPQSTDQVWGLMLTRYISRNAEWISWPPPNKEQEGLLTNSAKITGISNIKSKRKVQVVPYSFIRNFKAIDPLALGGPKSKRENADFEIGVDIKSLIKNKFVLDITLNPDFSQVESDRIQVTTNERFEVFFPEKRPFFLENADYFRTPINLFFSRRIQDPEYGVKFTGKSDGVSVGAIWVNDESPGKKVSKNNGLFGKSAESKVIRLDREIMGHSNIGVIYTDREFEDSFNRVMAVDGRIKINSLWVSNIQAAKKQN